MLNPSSGGSLMRPSSSNSNQSMTTRGTSRRRVACPFTCNKCRKPLSTSVFVCSCDCVFCEECTYTHFNQSSKCPNCQQHLSEHDFMELVVADPTGSKNTKSTAFQTLFTKQNSNTRSLIYQDMCARLLKQTDDIRASTKFLMKQFIMEVTKQSRRSTMTVRTLEALKQENTSLKQGQNTERMRFEKAIEGYQQKLTTAQTKLSEKDRQLEQFRQLHGNMTPERSSHRNSADGHPRRVSGEGGRGVPSQSYHSNARPSSSHSGGGGHNSHGMQEQQQPPIKAFMMQKEAQERAKQRALEDPGRAPPFFGNKNNSHRSHSHSQPPSSHSYGTPQPRGPPPPPQHFSFSGGGSIGSGSNGNNKRNHRAMSPSHAFASQQRGKYGGTARGPSNGYENSMRQSNPYSH